MTSAAESSVNLASTLTFQVDENDQSTVSYDPLTKPHGVYVTVHGHFYQPPRENPYLDAIERQPSATPFHDWNEPFLTLSPFSSAWFSFRPTEAISGDVNIAYGTTL